jgi:protein TonB
MSTITANYHFQPKDAVPQGTGLVVVVGLHVVLGYALVSGLARDIVKVIKKPLDAAVIQEVKLPPPPPPAAQGGEAGAAPKPHAAAAGLCAAARGGTAGSRAGDRGGDADAAAGRRSSPAGAAPPAPVARRSRCGRHGRQLPDPVRPEVPRGAEGVSGVVQAQRSSAMVR